MDNMALPPPPSTPPVVLITTTTQEAQIATTHAHAHAAADVETKSTARKKRSSRAKAVIVVGRRMLSRRKESSSPPSTTTTPITTTSSSSSSLSPPPSSSSSSSTSKSKSVTPIPRISRNGSHNKKPSASSSSSICTPSPSSSPLTQLPQELWLTILRLASLPPSSLLQIHSRSHNSSPSSSPSSSTSTTTTPPVSFLAFPHSHAHLHKTYLAHLKYKASLRLVCHTFALIAEELLFEFVWISRGADARRLAQLFEARVELAVREKGCWTDAEARVRMSPGRFMRRLHIETPPLERCCPADLGVILDHAPMLTVYSDYRSVRRVPAVLAATAVAAVAAARPSSSSSSSSNGFWGSSTTRTTTTTTSTSPSSRSDSLSSYSPAPHDPAQLLALLAHPGNSLRRLSWTNYEYDSEDYEGGVSFYGRFMAPMLQLTAQHLEFLELNFCSYHLHGSPPGPFSTTTASKAAINAIVPPTLTPLALPALMALKVTLDNATFSVLATWDMPALTNLSVLSADFSYAAAGFAKFFEVHGPKLLQLELGHSTGAIEEHYLTAPWGGAPGGGIGIGHIPLADWCPRLREFICSADAEWNWQSPDWIAPHVLLPTHPTLEFIGIRDMEKRLIDDLQMSEGRWAGDHGGGDGEQEFPFFMLEEQFGSLLRREAFPSLIYIRDMSFGSDEMRREGRVWLDGDASRMERGIDGDDEPRGGFLGMMGFPWKEDKEKRKRRERERVEEEARLRGRAVLKFWRRVLESCKTRGVWFEDCKGVNITLQSLRRAECA